MLVVDDAAEVARALDGGKLVVVPTDTVYGLAALASDEAAVACMYACKQRDPAQPTAVVFASVEQLLETLVDVNVRTRWAIQALLPGPWTLVMANAGGIWPWLTGGAPGPIGVRVPAGALQLPPLAATSANVSGRPTAEGVAALDPEIVDRVTHAIDRGLLPAQGESTVLDLVAWSRGEGDVVVLRDTARRAGQALAVLDGAPV